MEDGFPPPMLPPESTIDVWIVDLDSRLNPGVHLDNLLSAEERSRAERFIFARDAMRFRLCRAMLRMGLAWYLGKSPSGVALTTRWKGKPCLAEDSGLYFNISHSKGLALMAFTTLGEVGIDVETIDRRVEAMEIASAYFTAQETAMIAAAGTASAQAEVFLRFWTRKEAVLKAAGCGILHGLNEVDASQEPPLLVRLNGDSEEISGPLWLVRDLELPVGFTGAVAAAPGDWSIRQWSLREEGAVDRFFANSDTAR